MKHERQTFPSARARRGMALLWLTAAAGGTLGGCLGTLTGSLDLLLSPSAVESAVRLPSSAVGGIAEFFVRISRILG
ncbi:MAG: hypothetical protein IPM64_09915 [Phycisphaerales bacterium]|nr:hypothetical protein [Phycisphaerales bacterium]